MQGRHVGTTDSDIKVYVGTNGEIKIWKTNARICDLSVEEATILAKYILEGIAEISNNNARALAQIPDAVQKVGQAYEESVEATERFKNVAKDL